VQPSYGQAQQYEATQQQVVGQQWQQQAPQQPAQPQWNPTSQPQFGQPVGGGKKLLIVFGAVGAGLVMLVVSVVVLALVLGGNDPKRVAADFFRAVESEDWEKVCAFSSAERQQSLFAEVDADNCSDAADALAEQAEDDGPWGDHDCVQVYRALETTYSVRDADEDGDRAEVDYESVTAYTGDVTKAEECFLDPDDYPETEEDTLILVKEDGKWKVDH
jgi:hypothetical protein